MYHVLVQRKSINLCRPLLRNIDFACWPFPQFVSESNDTMVLSCTLTVFASSIGHLEAENRHFIIGRWLSGFPYVQWQDISSHFGICAVSWIPLALLVVSSPLSIFFHHWLLFRGSFSCTACIWHTRKTHRVVGSWTCSSSDLHQIMNLLLCSSCWLMRYASMLSFQQVSFHRLQLIYSGYET